MSTVPYVITELHWQGTPGEPPRIDAVIRFHSGFVFNVAAVPPAAPGDPWMLEVEGPFSTRAEQIAAQYLSDGRAELIAVLRAAVEDESAHLLPGTVTGTIGSGIARIRVDEP
jgi:hypothetical protein